jgi:DNA-directed RNA polymerase subunit RPC12/RpoP
MNKTNKELGFYFVQYVCMNCSTKTEIKVDFGKPMPYFSTDKNSIEKGYALQAPECRYCGCLSWSHGKKSE